MSKSMAFQFAMVVAVTLAACGAALAAPPAGEAKAPAADAAAEFVAPPDAKAAKRLGGFATRCTDDPDLYVSVLAPAQTVGIAATEQPTVYWYVSKATDDPVEI